MKNALFLSLMIGFILSSCTRDKSINSTVEDGGFAVFLVDNEEELWQLGADPSIAAMKLEPTPLFTAADLEYYKWSTHEMHLKPSRCPITIDQARHYFFVVTVGQEKIYYGEFSVLDIMPRVFDSPHITLLPRANNVDNLPILDCQCRIQEHPGLRTGIKDLRPDQRIYDALKKAGKLI